MVPGPFYALAEPTVALASSEAARNPPEDRVDVNARPNSEFAYQRSSQPPLPNHLPNFQVRGDPQEWPAYSILRRLVGYRVGNTCRYGMGDRESVEIPTRQCSGVIGCAAAWT